MLGEVTHLRLGELDVLDRTCRQLRQAVADFLVGQVEVGAVQPVEAHGQLAHRHIPAVLHVGQDRLDYRADLLVAAAAVSGLRPCFRYLAMDFSCRPCRRYGVPSSGLHAPTADGAPLDGAENQVLHR